MAPKSRTMVVWFMARAMIRAMGGHGVVWAASHLGLRFCALLGALVWLGFRLRLWLGRGLLLWPAVSVVGRFLRRIRTMASRI